MFHLYKIIILYFENPRIPFKEEQKVCIFRKVYSGTPLNFLNEIFLKILLV